MKLSDVKIGDKFYFLKEDNTSNRMYIKIDLDLQTLFPTLTRDYRDFSTLVAALDLSTYQISCLNGNYEVEVEHDNAFI